MSRHRLKTHQRERPVPRGHPPSGGVVQEVYGLLLAQEVAEEIIEAHSPDPSPAGGRGR